jgi:hypothetical protein
MTTSKSNAAYDTLISLHDKLTCINGVITPEAVNKLEDELGGIFTVTKIHHYKQGQKYGHLASAIPKQKHRLVIGNATWAYTVPGNPGAYLQAALGIGNSAALREQHVADSTRSSRRATMTTLASKRQARSSFYTQWATLLLPHSKNSTLALEI